jgi:hypothetical protein
MTIVWMAVAFFAGIILGTITMGIITEKKIIKEREWGVFQALRWADEMDKRGRLQEALAEFYETWEEQHATNRSIG